MFPVSMNIVNNILRLCDIDQVDITILDFKNTSVLLNID